MSRVKLGINDLETWCKKHNKNYILEKFDYDKNFPLTPKNICFGSDVDRFWLCKKGHSFSQPPSSRTYQGFNCPYCSNQKVLVGYNDFETWCHKNNCLSLLDEWDYSENNKLGTTPQNITYGYNKMVFWKCEEGHIYPSYIHNRLKGIGCPYCSGKKVLKGYNDFETYCKNNNLEYLLDEWDYEKNDEISVFVDGITAHSGKRVHWRCRFCGNEWRTTIDNRIGKKTNCKKCNLRGTSFSEQAILFYVQKHFFNVFHRYTDLGMELDIYIPSIKTAIEYDGVTFHQNKQDLEIKKNQLCKDNGIKLIRIREEGLCFYDDCVCIYRNNINNKNSLNIVIKQLLSCLGISAYDVDVLKDNIAILEQYKLSVINNSLTVKFPEIAKEWHPTKNGNLKPEYFACGDDKNKFWWLCPVCGSEYKCSIYGRTIGKGCYKCARKKHMKKVRCIETTIVYDSITEASRQCSVNTIGISNACKGKQHTAGGYHWEFIND